MCGILVECHCLARKIVSKHSNSHKLKKCLQCQSRDLLDPTCVWGGCGCVYVFVKWMNDNGVCASLEDHCSELKFGEPVSAQLYKQWVTFISQPLHECEFEFECVVHGPVHLPQWQKNDPLCQVTLVSEQRGGEVKHVQSHGRSDSVWKCVCVCVDVWWRKIKYFTKQHQENYHHILSLHIQGGL